MSTKKIEQQFQILRTLLAIGIAMVIAFVIICFISESPLETIRSFVLGPWQWKVDFLWEPCWQQLQQLAYIFR